MDKHCSGLFCFLSWLVATALFVGMIALLGGPTETDATESVYSTWAIAHGNLVCAYPPVTPQKVFANYQPLAHIPPLWPLVSGGLSALLRIGHAVAFPPSSSFGAHCLGSYSAMYQWAGRSFSFVPTIGLGYLSWLVLLAGIVAFVRAAGRGRRGWEPAALAFVALVPIVWMPLINFYHPQDLVAVGLALGAMACVERGAWVWAGALLGLAVTSQQFALLVVASLVVVVPNDARWKLILSSVGAWVVLALPMVAVTLGQGWNPVTIGSGDFQSYGGTVLWELRLHGAALVFTSRVMPILVSVALAWWVRRRLGSRALEPVPLVALVATCLSMRLVFEVNLFGYYFMALAVMLVLLDIVRGRIRGELVVWIVLVTLAFNPVPNGLAFNARPWGDQVFNALPVVCLAIALLMMIWDAVHRRIRWYLVTGFVLAALVFGHWPPWVTSPLRERPPFWLWQLVLVSSGVALAAGPLVKMMRGASESQSELSVQAKVKV